MKHLVAVLLALLLALPAHALIESDQIGQADEHDTMRADSNGVYQEIANNITAGAPDSDNDVDEGYAVGSVWVDTTADRIDDERR